MPLKAYFSSYSLIAYFALFENVLMKSIGYLGSSKVVMLMALKIFSKTFYINTNYTSYKIAKKTNHIIRRKTKVIISLLIL